jgi:diguanylate cyclase (GGDEF)-like protein
MGRDGIKLQPAALEQDGRDEVLELPEAVGSLLHRLDLRVDALGGGVGDAVVDGTQRTFQETIFPIRLDGGKRVGVAGIATDLTEVRQQQAMLAERLEELDRSRHVSSLTSECVELVQRCVTIDESLELTSRYLARMYPKANLTVYEKQEGHQDLALRTKERRFEPFFAKDLLDASDCWAVRTRRVYATLPAGSRIHCRHLAASVGACACAPLFATDQLVGLVSLAMPPERAESAGYAEKAARWVAQFETTMQSLAGALSTVMLRESLQRLALVDELTGMPNRRAFVVQAQRAIARARRAGEKVAVAVFDIDHFRQVNDRWGRDAGDRVLQQVAELGSSFFRADDTLARVGGEEFAALLLLGSQADALRRLDAFRAEVALRCRVGHQPITVSIGFCFTDPKLPTTVEDLLQQAESALGEAKRAGRDRVLQVGATAPTSAPPPSLGARSTARPTPKPS